MPGKHKTVFPLRRYGFIGGAATLLVVLVSWVAVRSVGPAEADQRTPLMVQPTVPLAVAPAPVTPDPTPSSVPPTSVSAPATSPTPSASATTTARPTTAVPEPTAKTTRPKPPRTTRPTPPAATFTARYVTGGSWDRGFIAGLEVTNTGRVAAGWTVTLAYDPAAGVRIGNAWNAQADGLTLTGGTLAPGASASAGFQASKQVRGRIQPTSCSIGGVACRLG